MKVYSYTPRVRDEELQRQIKKLAKEKNAVLIAHNYQRPEIQAIADIAGDSLGLSRAAAQTSAEMIVFCGVRFMAETASILCPEKKVLLPSSDAGCPMADMIDEEKLIALKKKHPQAAVVSYVNTTSEIKALSDICCTSTNAVKVIESLVDYEEIIFVPDYNLGHYISRFTSKKIILYDGNCPTHMRLTSADILAAKAEYPDSVVVAHPECSPDVLDLADKVLSTGGMVQFVPTSAAKNVILATERDMAYRLLKDSPDKQIIIPSSRLICPNMKITNLKAVYNALLNEEELINVDEPVRHKARVAIDKMIAIG